MDTRPVGHPGVHERAGVVESPPHGRSQPYSQAPYVVVGVESDGRGAEPVAGVHVHVLRSVDEHVGDARQRQQRLQRAGADAVAVAAPPTPRARSRRTRGGRTTSVRRRCPWHPAPGRASRSSNAPRPTPRCSRLTLAGVELGEERCTRAQPRTPGRSVGRHPRSAAGANAGSCGIVPAVAAPAPPRRRRDGSRRLDAAARRRQRQEARQPPASCAPTPPLVHPERTPAASDRRHAALHGRRRRGTGPRP
jgi:hypothetical protein